MHFIGASALLVGMAAIAAGAEPDLAEGRALFISNCSFCHGAKGEGGRGASLISPQSTHGRGTDDLKRVITKGVPGSQMPGFGQFEKDELQNLVTFLQTLTAGAPTAEKIVGDKAAGAKLYAANKCSMCHRIDGEGSVYGPDLSRAGAGRSLAYLRDSIAKPSADIPNEYKGVTVTTQDGVRVSGVRINEDAFSVQLRDLGQRFRMFDKAAVSLVAESKVSLMPPYALTDRELNDLLAYLVSLRGRVAAGEDARQAEGIH